MKKLKGFGLQIDALGAIICMLILSAIVVVVAANFINNSRYDKASSDAASLGSLVSQYHYEIGIYPETLEKLKDENGQYGPYVTEIKKDPWGNTYQYKFDNDEEKFVIYSYGKDKADSGSSIDSIKSGDIGYIGK